MYIFPRSLHPIDIFPISPYNGGNGGVTMKRLIALFAVLALMTGCGAQAQSDTASAQTSQAPQTWGTEEAPAAPEEALSTVSSLEESSMQEDSQVEESLPQSLRELCPQGPRVLLDGRELYSISLQDVTLIRAADLSDLFGWFQTLGGGEEGEFTRKSGETFSVSCMTVRDGDEAALYSGQGGLRFQGAQEEYWLPVRALAQELELELLWDEEENTVYLTASLDMEAIPQGEQVPILMYHAVSDDMWGIESLFVSPEDLRAQLSYLRDEGYDPIFLSDLPHLSDYDKPILLTFDDGYDDNYTELYPILQEYGVKATVFVITGMLGDEHYLTAEQVEELSRSGLVDIQSHTVSHEELSTLSYEAQEQELAQSRLELARITGKIPYALAYPSGERDEDTLTLAPEYYSFGLDMNGGTWTIAGDYFRIDRIYVSRYTTLEEFIALLP